MVPTTGRSDRANRDERPADGAGRGRAQPRPCVPRSARPGRREGNL